MNYADEKQLIDMWRFEERFPFGGWDLMHLDGRWESEPLPWDYRDEVIRRLKATDMLLDMDTGDGGFLLSLGIRMSLPAPRNRTGGTTKAAWSSLRRLAYARHTAAWTRRSFPLTAICSTLY